MKFLIELVVSLGFGGLAWVMLLVSDWLLRDRPPRLVLHLESRPPSVYTVNTIAPKTDSARPFELSERLRVLARRIFSFVQSDKHLPRSHHRMD